MIYAKIHLNDGVEIKTDINNLEYSSVCPICGVESPLDAGDLPDDLSDGYFCDKCNEDTSHFIIEQGGMRLFNWLDMLLHSDYPSNIFTYALRHAPNTVLDQVADEFSHMVPGYHDDLPIGDINNEIERREKAKKQVARCLRENEL